MKPLIITGFCARENDYEQKLKFLGIWLTNTGDTDIVVIDNNEVKPLEIQNPKVRIIRINKNLGPICEFEGQFRPHLLGYSVGWIIGALIAYSEGRDLIYKEQDCLWFGDMESEILRRAETGDLAAQLGYAKSAPARVESCLFWVRHDFITEFVTKYMEQSPGDGVRTPEEKFNHISKCDNRVVPLPFGVGRDRPLPVDHPVWYAQRVTDEELAMLREKGLVC